MSYYNATGQATQSQCLPALPGSLSSKPRASQNPRSARRGDTVTPRGLSRQLRVCWRLLDRSLLHRRPDQHHSLPLSSRHLQPRGPIPVAATAPAAWLVPSDSTARPPAWSPRLVGRATIHIAQRPPRSPGAEWALPYGKFCPEGSVREESKAAAQGSSATAQEWARACPISNAMATRK